MTKPSDGICSKHGLVHGFLSPPVYAGEPRDSRGTGERYCSKCGLTLRTSTAPSDEAIEAFKKVKRSVRADESREQWLVRQLEAANAVDFPKVRAEARAATVAEIVGWLSERLEGPRSACVTVNLDGFAIHFSPNRYQEDDPHD